MEGRGGAGRGGAGQTPSRWPTNSSRPLTETSPSACGQGVEGAEDMRVMAGRGSLAEREGWGCEAAAAVAAAAAGAQVEPCAWEGS